jgi:hypothetical protein
MQPLGEGRTNTTALVSLWICLGVVACVDQPDDLDSDDPSDGEVELDTVSKLAGNALTPAQLWASVPLLGSSTLDTANLQVMASTSDGRKALKYVVECALDASQQVSVTVAKQPYVFEGGLGLAPGWTLRALTATQQQSVSACVLSLVNVFGSTVMVSLRGSSLALAESEAADYQIEEGAFWGNLFLGGGSWAAACDGADQARDDSYGDLPRRECAEPAGHGDLTICGFTYAGLCSSACSTSGPYTGCKDATHPAATEVLTTYLAGLPR